MAVDIFDLVAKIKIDTSDFEKGVKKSKGDLDDFGKSASTFGQVLKANLVSGAITKGLSLLGSAIKSVTGSMAGLIKQSVSAYGEYEQLVGGVETLFKGSSDTIKKYAEKAYQTAGLSANQYMETVTSFSASLIQSTGRGTQQDIDVLKGALKTQLAETKRSYQDDYDALKKSWNDKIKAVKSGDTQLKEALRAQRDEELKELKRSNEDKLAEMKAYNEQQVAEAERANSASTTTEESLARAAKLADMAVTDMADNANKLGTSMDMIQNAYQGFAKQNYTINLMSAA